MRRNFAQVLKEGKIDLKNEYSKFYKIFYGKDSRDDRSIADMVLNNFIHYHFRGTCLSLKEFNEIMKGNVEAKRDILIKLANVLKSYDGKLNGINQTFKSDLFQLINSCNIRHNNKDKSSKHYKKYIAEMSDTVLEHTYDEIYQM